MTQDVILDNYPQPPEWSLRAMSRSRSGPKTSPSASYSLILLTELFYVLPVRFAKYSQKLVLYLLIPT